MGSINNNNIEYMSGSYERKKNCTSKVSEILST
jgi:hypothetical protein